MSSSCKLPSHFLTYIFSFRSTYGTFDLQASSRFLRDYATREINALLWISLIAVTALLLEELFKVFRLRCKASRITGPPCNSFFGHNSFGSRENFIDFLSELHNTYGPVVKLWMGPTLPLVSVKDPALVKEILLKAEDKLPSTGKAFQLAFGRSNLFFCSYDQAQQTRESLELQLKISLGKAGVIPKCAVDHIMERIDENMGKGSDDCKLLCQHMAFTILGTTLLGDAFLAWSKANIYEELLMRIAKETSFWASYRVTPFWKQGFWRYQSLCTKLRMLTQDIVQQCRKNCRLFHHLDINSDDEMVECGMNISCGISPSDIILQDKNFSWELGSHVNAIEEPSGNIMCMMFHGCIATAGLMGNMLDRLVKDPELQDKIYLEIIMAKQKMAEEGQNVDRMVLLLATIYESARISSAGPLLQRCSLKDDLRLKNGVIIPAGAVVVVPVHLLQMDKTSWGSDANRFNPYRFLSEARSISDSLKDTSYIENTVDPIPSSFVLKDPNENPAFLPFGFGTRDCVGQKFVVQGIASLFASLLEQYKVILKPRSDTDPKSTNPGIIFVRRSS